MVTDPRSWRRWPAAWQDALYGPDGFYRQAAGPAQHFATSAQGIPGGGAWLARAVLALASRYGCEQIVEIGAGRGELLGELAAARSDLPLFGLDVVARPAGLAATVRWQQSPGGSELPDALPIAAGSLVLCHEWLDVVPCEIVEFDGAIWRIVEVTTGGDERLGDSADEASLHWLQRNWPAPEFAGERAEVGTTRDAAYQRVCALAKASVVVAVDYGHRAAERPHGGTLRGYRTGGQVRPVPDGTTDITADVAMDTLGADRLVRQSAMFDELGVSPQRPDRELALTDPPEYLRLLSARSGYAELTRAGGLGEFWWAIRDLR